LLVFCVTLLSQIHTQLTVTTLVYRSISVGGIPRLDRYNEFLLTIFEGALFGKRAVGRPRLRSLKQVTRNTAADSYTAMERMACNKFRWKAAKQSKD